MVPSFEDDCSRLPTTSSGKIDRRRWPVPAVALDGASGQRIAPRNEAGNGPSPRRGSPRSRATESRCTTNFFLDIRGPFVAAASVISRLRRKPGFERADRRPLRPSDLESWRPGWRRSPARHGAERRIHEPVSAERHFAAPRGSPSEFCFFAGLYAWQWLGAFLTYGYWPSPIIRSRRPWPGPWWPIWSRRLDVLSRRLRMAAAGRSPPGRYRLWGWFYLRFWFVRAVVRAAPVSYLDGTPLSEPRITRRWARRSAGTSSCAATASPPSTP